LLFLLTKISQTVINIVVAKVRPWRVAHREIRGIAGGRFLARCWVGSRDSDYASARAIAEAEKPPTTASAPPTKSRAKGAKGSNPLPNVPSLVPSRSSSTVPELNTSASAPLTKMRNIIEAETVAQDAESTAEAS
jgi:Wiskott-Aldrich syndrome protein